MGVAVCAALALSSCKSSESAYKKAYEKAKEQELASSSSEEVVQEQETVAPVVTESVQTVPTADVREERVTVVTGNGLKKYSVVCGSFSVKANAENLKAYLDSEGYSALVVLCQEKSMYRVIVSTFDDRASAASARDAFKAAYPSRQDFQGSWLLYNVD